MGFLELYQKARIDPKFRALTYNDQRKVLSDLLTHEISTNEQMKTLSPQDQNVVGQQLFDQYISKYQPILNGYDGSLSPEDRVFLDQYYNKPGFSVVPSGADPNLNYKIALYLGEKLDQKDPLAAEKAKTWITTNKVINESLLTKIALGAKDAVEYLVGSDDKIGNDLAFHAQDYNNLAEMLTSKMKPSEAALSQQSASIAGFVTGLVENVALTSVIGGSGPGSGLFLKPVWQNLETKTLLAKKVAERSFYAWTLPRIVSSTAQGVVDVTRSLPQLLEKGNLQGPKAFWEGVAGSFGTGVAYDLFGQLVNDAFHIMIKPIKSVFGKSLEVNTQEQVKKIGELLQGTTDQGKLSDIFNSIMNGDVRKELIDQLDPESKAEVIAKIIKGNALVKSMNFNPRSPEGFKVLGKAMGFDVDYLKEGIEAVGSDGIKHTFSNMAETMSFMQDNLPKVLGNLNDEINAWSGAVKLTKTVRTNLSASDLPTEQLKSGLFRSVEYGQYNPKQTESYLKGILEKTNPPSSSIKFVPEKEFLESWATKKVFSQITLPETVSSRTVAESVSTYLTDIVGKLTGPVAYQESSTSALREALKRISQNLDLRVDNSGYHISGIGANELTFSRFEDANEQVWKLLYDSGQLGFKELQNLVHANTGFRLVRSVNKELGRTSYALRGAGKFAKDLDSLDDLFKPENAIYFGTKLPENLMPQVALGLDGGVYFTSTMTSGSPAEMLSFMESYRMKDVAVGSKLKKVLADGSKVVVKATDNGMYRLEVPNLGIGQEFDSFESAKRAFTGLGKSGLDLELAVARKGMALSALGNGSVALTDSNGLKAVFNNGTELRQFLGSLPDDPGIGELLSQDLTDDAKALVDTVSRIKWNPKVELPNYNPSTAGELIDQTKLLTDLDTYIRPASSYLRKESGRYGIPELAQLVDSVEAGKSLMTQGQRNAHKVLEAILEGADEGQRKLYTQLMQVGDRSVWPKVAKTLMGDAFELSGDDIRRVESLKTWLQTAGKIGDIDLLGFFENRLPHYRPPRSEGELAQILASTPANRMAFLFPGVSSDDRTLNWISRNMRLDDFVNQTNEQDILQTLKMYSDKLYQERYLQPSIDKFQNWIKSARETTIPKSIVDTADRYRMMLLGIPDQTTVGQRQLSLKVSKVLSNTLNKMGDFFGSEAPEGGFRYRFSNILKEQSKSVITDDVLGAVNRNSMVAVLGFRPFAAYRNSLESAVKGYPIFGEHFAKAMKEVDEEYIAGLFEKGLLSDRIFEASDNTYASILRKIKEVGMQPIQNSEIYSRALIAYSAEDAFDSALKSLRNGIVKDAQQFRDLAKLNLFTDTEFDPIWKALQAGNSAAAKDITMHRVLEVVMGNYQPENKPKLFTGYFGKLFGTFGVYSASTIDLYRRIATTGPMAQRFMTLAKLAFMTTSLTNAFRALGVDYSGFTLSDTLGFNGGPIWASMIDITRASGSSPEAAVSRQNLFRNFSFYIPKKGLNIPRLLTPGANELSYAEKGIESLLNGGPGAIQELLGAPYLKKGFSWKFL